MFSKDTSLQFPTPAMSRGQGDLSERENQEGCLEEASDRPESKPASWHRLPLLQNGLPPSVDRSASLVRQVQWLASVYSL